MTADIIEYKGHNDRRERIATAALQGILSANPTWADIPDLKLPGEFASMSILLADALIAALDKEAS